MEELIVNGRIEPRPPPPGNKYTPRPAEAGHVQMPSHVKEGMRLVHELRQRILEEARRLFEEEGYGSTSLQQILDAVGCSKGAFYHYFASKSAVLLEIQMEAITQANKRAESIATDDAPVQERVSTFIVSSAHTVIENRRYMRLYLELPSQLAPAEIRTVQGERRAYEDVLADLLREGIEDGVFRSDLDAAITAKAMLGLANSSHRWFVEEGALTADEVAWTYAEMMMNGLCARR